MKRHLPRIALWLALWLPWLYVGVFAYTADYYSIPHFPGGPHYESREYGWPYPCLELGWNLQSTANDPSADVRFFYPSLLAVNLLVSVAVTTVFAIIAYRWIATIRKQGFRFRISTLLLLVVVVSLPLAGWRYVDDEYRREKAIESQLGRFIYVHWTDEPLIYSRLEWILPERVGQVLRRVESARIGYPTSIIVPANTMDLLAQLKHLESLGFDDLSEPDDMLPFLRKLPNLKRVYFDRTPVTDAGIQHLHQCPWLEEIEFEATSEVSADGIQRLRAALPDTQIIYDEEETNE